MNSRRAPIRSYEARDYPEKELTEKIIGAAIEVHKQVGPGLLESVYQACLAREFSIQEIPFVQEKTIPIQYKGVQLESGYRLDFLVDDKVIVELKALDELTDSHKAQLLTYLRVTGRKVGLLINFNAAVLKNGIKCMVL